MVTGKGDEGRVERRKRSTVVREERNGTLKI